MNSKGTRLKSSNIKLHFIGVILFIVILSLQFSLWGERGLLELWTLNRANNEKALNNEKLRARNQRLIDELAGLKSGNNMIEELAREDLGLVKPGETFFKIIENQRTEQDVPQ